MGQLFGVGDLTVSGHAIGRLNNVTINVTYDSSVLRGGPMIFPNACVLYNGNIEGTFENGEIDTSAIGDMLGADQGAGPTITLTSVSLVSTGMDLIFSGETNGVTAQVTLFNCFIPGLTLNIDRENWTMPSMNFIVAGETSASGGRVMKISES